MVYMYIVSVAAASFAFFFFARSGSKSLIHSFFVTPFCKHVQLSEHQVQQYNLWR